MSENRNNLKPLMIFLVLMTVLAVIFIDFMGYLNYRTAAIELEETLIRQSETQAVTEMEMAVGFGKDFRNYYGVNEIFESFRLQFPGPQPFIIDREGKLLYNAEGEWENPDRPQEYLNSDAFTRGFDTILAENGGVISERGLHAVFSPIRQDGETIGFFGCIFTDGIFQESFSGLIRRIIILTAISIPVISALLFIAIRLFVKRREKMGRPVLMNQIKMLGLILLAVGILAVSAISIYTYQKDYVARIRDSVQTSLQNLGRQIDQVKKQGVDLREVPDLRNYIQKQISMQENVRTVRIVDRIYEVQRTEERSELISYVFSRTAEGKDKILLEAELSDTAMNREMRTIMLVLISSMVILLLFLFEFNTLSDLMTGRKGAGKEPAAFSERQMSRTLRFTSFLYATSEYMCAPYAAMMIRSRGESLFGLSVGMTAALPLTVEGLTQMLAMLFLPRLVRKWKIRPVLVCSGILMIGCNVAAFMLNGALAIILCRALAGVAYAGFKLVANGMIIGGYDTEIGRSKNIAQNNAGVLSGAICGAGLGAILSGSAGYETAFLCSAALFLVYLLFTLRLVPWGRLENRSVESEEKKIGIQNFLRVFRNPEMLAFILIIGVPLNIGIMLCMTLIPAVCQTQNISSVMLSYCYIANGLAGVFIGPALVSAARKRFGLGPSITLAFALTAAAIFLLHVPPVMVMIVVASMILGFLDGFATPMVTDLFMNLKVVKTELDESTALVFFTEITYVLLTVAPMIAEQLLLPGAMLIGAAVYAVAAVLALLFGIRRRQAAE